MISEFHKNGRIESHNRHHSRAHKQRVFSYGEGVLAVNCLMAM
jgi:hypothetical protein